MTLPALWRRELAGYGRDDFQADLLAGLTVAAVALPLALAFGVASGADAAAGLVTAIVGGALIALLGGSPFQISGPTGAMSAVLIVISLKYGVEGVWLAGAMAGAIILALGLLKLGKVISFIPSPVITGFTSGIALVIAIGQIDNVLGVHTEAAESSLLKVLVYFKELPAPHLSSLLTAAIVMAVMIGMPRAADRLPPALRRIPGSLIGIVLATIAAGALGWDVKTIGEIPRSIVLEHRLTPAALDLSVMSQLWVPAISIAALGAIESLLCGTVAGNMTGTKLQTNQELISQGIGNLVVPFFGGVPATAAIARTSVAIKSGARTRVTSLIHSITLLAIALAAAPVIARVPLAALGGVLMVTAYRMNEWEAIHFFVNGRHRHAMVAMFLTMLATVALDLTQAIVIGVAVSAVFFVRQASAIAVSRESVDVDRMRTRGHDLPSIEHEVEVIYVTGPLFFGSVHSFLEALEGVPSSARIILSMRGVPSIDAMGIQAIEEVVERQHRGGGEVHLSGLQDGVRRLIERSSIRDLIGDDRFHWSADHAIVAVHQNGTVESSGADQRVGTA